MGAWQFSVITLMILSAAADHAVIDGIGMNEAMCGVVAMAESQDGRRRHKAKGGENGDHHRRAKAKPGAECPHYSLSLVAGEESRKLAIDQKARYKTAHIATSRPRMSIANPPPARALVADIGGTNARFAVLTSTLALSEIGQFFCSEHGTLADAACSA
jgi:hypothetical protein